MELKLGTYQLKCICKVVTIAYEAIEFFCRNLI